MTEVSKVIHSFLSGFATAYPNDNVPDKAAFPYITYTVSYSPFGVENLMPLIAWTKGSSYKQLNAICDKIHAAIPEAGKVLYLDDDKGAVWLQRGRPFMQGYPQLDEREIKAAYINTITKSYIY